MCVCTHTENTLYLVAVLDRRKEQRFWVHWGCKTLERLFHFNGYSTTLFIKLRMILPQRAAGWNKKAYHSIKGS